MGRLIDFYHAAAVLHKHKTFRPSSLAVKNLKTSLDGQKQKLLFSWDLTWPPREKGLYRQCAKHLLTGPFKMFCLCINICTLWFQSPPSPPYSELWRDSDVQNVLCLPPCEDVLWVLRVKEHVTSPKNVCAEGYCKVQLCEGFVVSKRKIFWQWSVVLADVVWLNVNTWCKGAVACLYQGGGGKRGVTGIMFCHQTGGPVTGWAYKREDL